MKQIELTNGVMIPQIGLGTWQIAAKDILYYLVKEAYDRGYRLIDTAAAYSNEIALGKAIVGLGIRRQDLFLSDKVWNTCRGYDKVREACRASLKKLKTNYLDLYLVHWPASIKLYPDWREINAETWRGMESLYQEGLVRAIGICNFKVHHIEELKKSATIMPMINQLEFHPGMIQSDVVAFCEQEGIRLEASSPLGNGQILQNQTLLDIAERHHKTAAQICLRYAMEKDMIAIPKTEKAERLAENMKVFDFRLAEEEINLLDMLPYCGGIGIDSDEVVEFG